MPQYDLLPLHDAIENRLTHFRTSFLSSGAKMDRAHRQRIQITCSNRNKSMDDVKIYRKRAADIVSEHCSSTQEAAFVSRLVRISDHIVNQIELPATEQMSLKTAAASNKVLITTKMLLPDRKQTSLEKKMFLQNGRSTKPKEHTMLKYDNRDHGFVLKLADYLSPNAELGKHVVILIHMMVVGNAGWVKSCSASGHLNPDTLMHSVFSSMIMKKYGVSPERVWKIEVTSTGGSGRCYYHDKHNRKKDFQFGNFLAREIFTPTVNTTVMQQMITMANQHGLQQYQQYIESYFGEMEEAFRQFAHLLVPDDVGKALMDPKCWVGINLSMASTVVTDNVSRMHNHRDPKSCFPALLCCSDPFKNGTFDGGDLFMTDSAFRVKYSGRDIVFVDGSKYHAVLPISPRQHTKEVFRHSHAFFYNGHVSIENPADPVGPRRSKRLRIL